MLSNTGGIVTSNSLHFPIGRNITFREEDVEDSRDLADIRPLFITFKPITKSNILYIVKTALNIDTIKGDIGVTVVGGVSLVVRFVDSDKIIDSEKETMIQLLIQYDEANKDVGLSASTLGGGILNVKNVVKLGSYIGSLIKLL